MTAPAFPYPAPAPDPTAVVGRRIVAILIDLGLAMAVVLAIMVPAITGRARTVSASEFKCVSAIDSGSSDRKAVDSDLCWEWGDEVQYVPRDESNAVSLAFYGLIAGITFLDLVVLQSITGASLGKLLLGLRVIDLEGRRASPWRMTVRWFFLLLLGFCCCFLVDLVMVFSTKGHRRVGDMAGGTLVVGKDQLGRRPVVPGVTAPATTMAPYGAAPYGATPPMPTANPGAAPTTDGPIWDEARDTYIQWDAPRSQWVQWDEQAGEWRPIER